MKLLKIIICLIVISTINRNVFAEEQSKITVKGTVVRSLIIPGWGQHYLGNVKKAKKMFGIEAILWGGAIGSYLVSDRYYDKYMDSVNQDDIDKYYDKANLYHKVSNYLTIGAIIGWGYNVFDAYKEVKKVAKDDISLKIEADNSRFLIALEKRF